MFLKIRFQLPQIGNTAILPFPAVALLHRLCEVASRSFVTNNDIDLALCYGVVGNLVVGLGSVLVP